MRVLSRPSLEMVFPGDDKSVFGIVLQDVSID